MFFDAFLAYMLFGRFDLGDRTQVFAVMTVLAHSLKLRDSGVKPETLSIGDQSLAIFLSSTSRIAGDRVNSRARLKWVNASSGCPNSW